MIGSIIFIGQLSEMTFNFGVRLATIRFKVWGLRLTTFAANQSLVAEPSY
jgi:hypothetical protein